MLSIAPMGFIKIRHIHLYKIPKAHQLECRSRFTFCIFWYSSAAMSHLKIFDKSRQDISSAVFQLFKSSNACDAG